MAESETNPTALAVVPRELRIERRASNALRAGAITWLPLALLLPVALMIEVPAAAIGILLVAGMTVRELRRASGEILPHLELADSGDLESATHHVATMAKREPDWRRKTFLVGVLSTLELRAGNYESAEQLAREALRHPQPSRPVFERSLRANLAMILAVKGERQEALSLLPETPAPDPVTDTARMVVWAVDERWSDLADYRFARVPALSGMRHNLRVVALCKAMALHKTGRGQLTMQRYLDQARPRLEHEYDYLCAHWEALRLFLEQHPSLQKKRSILERA